MEQQGEGVLLERLSVQVTLDVVYFGLHTGKRGQEEVGMATPQVPQVRRVLILAAASDQIRLFTNYVPPVLQGHLWIVIQHFDDLLGRQVVLTLHVVHETGEVADFCGQEAVFVATLWERNVSRGKFVTYEVDNLRLGEFVFAEVSEELGDFDGVTAEQVGEVHEYFVDHLGFFETVVKLEKVQNFFHPLIQLHRQKLRTLENQLNALLRCQSTVLLQ